MAARRETPDAPANSAALSLLELRRHLLRRAGELSARARGLRKKGASSSAARLAVESDRLLLVAKTMGDAAAPKKST